MYLRCYRRPTDGPGEDLADGAEEAASGFCFVIECLDEGIGEVSE
jgi:hypothetical protein